VPPFKRSAAGARLLLVSFVVIASALPTVTVPKMAAPPAVRAAPSSFGQRKPVRQQAYAAQHLFNRFAAHFRD